MTVSFTGYLRHLTRMHRTHPLPLQPQFEPSLPLPVCACSAGLEVAVVVGLAWLEEACPGSSPPPLSGPPPPLPDDAEDGGEGEEEVVSLVDPAGPSVGAFFFTATLTPASSSKLSSSSLELYISPTQHEAREEKEDSSSRFSDTGE